MENYFDKEMLRIEQEIIDLKTAMNKSAVGVDFEEKSVSVSIPLSLNASQTSAEGSKIYRVNCSKDALVVPTLNWYYGDIYKSNLSPAQTRRLALHEGIDPNGDVLIEVVGIGTEIAGGDVDTLKNGGSVTLTGTLTVKCSGSFSLEAV